MSNAPYLLMQGALRLPLRRRHADRRDARGRPARSLERQADVRAGERGRRRARHRIARISTRWALRSHERAIAAIDAGRFAEEIVAVEVRERAARPRSSTRRGRRAATPRSRRSPRCGRSCPSTRRTRPATRPGVNDGAAALVVADEEWADAQRPRRRSPASAAIGCTANRHDSLARVPARAAQIALERAGLAVGRRRPLRDQRGLRLGRAPVEPRPRRRSRACQRRRRRGRARPPGRRLGRAPADDAAAPAARERRRDRRGRDLLGRRPGRRDGARGLPRAHDRTHPGRRRRPDGRRHRPGRGDRRACDVTLVDVDERSLERGLAADPRASLARLHEKGQCDDPDASLARISTVHRARGGPRLRA